MKLGKRSGEVASWGWWSAWAALACVCAGWGVSCGVEVQGPEPPRDRLVFPVGLALHPSGNFLYVVNSNFDVEFREDRGGTVSVIDTDRLEIIPDAGVQIGTFGGEIKLNAPPEGGPTHAYVAVRGDRSVTALDIESGGAVLRCNGQVLTEACQVRTAGDDPFGLAVATVEVNAPSTGPLWVDFVAVAHLIGGNVSAFSFRGEGSSRSTTQVSAPLVSGANAIAQSPRTGQFYVSSRFTNTVVGFRPVFSAEGDLEAVFQTDEVTVEGAAPFNGLDSRGIGFNGAGTMAFVANRGPNSLLFVDVGPTDPLTGAGTRNRVVDVLPLPGAPADVQVLTVGGRELVYVTSYASELVTVIDPVSHAVIGTIDVPGQPYGMAVDQVRHQRLYLSLFNAGAVAVVDLDPTSPSFHEVIAVIR